MNPQVLEVFQPIGAGAARSTGAAFVGIREETEVRMREVAINSKLIFV
jgi:hypothetical protein